MAIKFAICGGRRYSTRVCGRSALGYPHDFEVFNVASGRPQTVRHLVQSICRHLHVAESLLAWGTIPNRPSEGRFWIGNNQKISRIAGWYPQIDLEWVIQAACDFYKKADAP